MTNTQTNWYQNTLKELREKDEVIRNYQVLVAKLQEEIVLLRETLKGYRK